MIDGIFAGLKVLELGGGAAGPISTRYFADQRATVVRVESVRRPDFLRLLHWKPGTPGGVDASLHFACLNANKRSVALDLTLAEGRAVARRLALWADVVAESFAPGTMARWGLDWPSLAGDRPDLVMVSTCLYGQTGPEREYAGFGGQGSAIAGFNHLTGWPDREPVGPFGAITDSLSPRAAALLVGTALLHRRRTGRGRHVDLSQVEVGVYCLAEATGTFDANGTVLGRMGYRSPHAAPHAVLPARGDDRWVTVVCHDDEDWRRLRAALGDPDWARDPELDTVSGRLARADDVEARLADWTRERSPGDIAEHLQANGVEAGIVADFGDLHEDPQLAFRAHFRRLAHPVIGEHAVETGAIRFSDAADREPARAPLLGEHTEEVLCGLLGMSGDEYRALDAKGVLR
ncbi:MAG: hypothetical protein QOD06_2205 [Candidatus Binatota bacterium]|nr:hypothetical protein [Candidatus Binatota bacterium]